MMLRSMDGAEQAWQLRNVVGESEETRMETKNMKSYE